QHHVGPERGHCRAVSRVSRQMLAPGMRHIHEWRSAGRPLLVEGEQAPGNGQRCHRLGLETLSTAPGKLGTEAEMIKQLRETRQQADDTHHLILARPHAAETTMCSGWKRDGCHSIACRARCRYRD